MRKLGILLVLGSLGLMVACGGGSSNSSGGSNGTITSVTAFCSPSTVQYGQSSQCSATVMGTGNFSSAVTWTASTGSISSSGVFNAPSAGNVSLLVTVTATSTQDTSKSGTATITVNPVQMVNNVAPIIVDAGPDPVNAPTVNTPFVTITICVPGNPSQCQTIDHVEVDTGSSGLRIVSSVLTISLPQANNSTLDECLVFEDGYVWGPVATATITVTGETASNVPVQIMIPTSTSPPVPSSCSSQNPPGGNGNEGVSVDAFGAKALIGVGLFQQDCGPGCTTNPAPDFYYDCSSVCTPTTVALAQQVANPVSMFPADNNGVLIQLPAVPDGGSPTANGNLIFGIGTQSNNGLGTATVYTVPDSGNNAGDFTTIFNGTSYPQGFIDSGSNGIFFLNSKTAGVPATCADQTHWYCPTTSPDNLTASNQGTNMSSAVPVNFSIENADALLATDNTAFSTLGGPNPGAFDWGLPFFFGRDVFTAIENMSAPGGIPPYFAYNLP